VKKSAHVASPSATAPARFSLISFAVGFDTHNRFDFPHIFLALRAKFGAGAPKWPLFSRPINNPSFCRLTVD
jgi:hypothetical protein